MQEKDTSSKSLQAGDQQQEGTTDNTAVESSTPDKNGTMHLHAHNRILSSILVICALSILGLLAYWAGNNYSLRQSIPTGVTELKTDQIKLTASIEDLKGDVQHSADGVSWRDLSVGDQLIEGDYVRTHADSRAEIYLDDGSIVRLDSGSKIQLSVLETQQIDILLHDGHIYSRVSDRAKRDFSVVTLHERFEARGTAFAVQSGKKSDTLSVFHAKVLVESDEINVDQGNSYDTGSKLITEIDRTALEDNSFIAWNNQRDTEHEEYRKKLGIFTVLEKPKSSQVEVADTTSKRSFTLEGVAVTDGIELSWQFEGYEARDGFKLLRDQSDKSPKYGSHTSVYMSDNTMRRTVLSLTDGKQYHFRACIYSAERNTCEVYSNTVSVKAPESFNELVKNGDVDLQIDERVLSWTFEGTAPHGFKVVLSQESKPSYPENSIAYIGPGRNSHSLPDKPEGEYYVRVCKYTADFEIDNGCTNYSNQVKYIVEP